jgi:alpha-galactosidase
MIHTKVRFAVLTVLTIWIGGGRATCEVSDASEMEFLAALNRSWADQVFSSSKVPAAPANSVLLIREDAPGDTKAGSCAAGGPLRLGTKTYERGIGVNSNSVLRVTLAQPAARFLADIGLDRNVDGTAASARFHVNSGGKDLYVTDVLRPTGAVQSIDVPLAGARTFDLIVDDGGDGRGWDQGNWADARVVLEDGSEVWLDNLARQAILGRGLPFSFVYDGRHSSDLLDSWKRMEQEERIDATKVLRKLTLTDPSTGLEVLAQATVYTDAPGVDWTLFLTNTGTADTPILEKMMAVDTSVHLGMGVAPQLHRLNGSLCVAEDWLPFDQPVPTNSRIDFAATNGRSSNICPFFNLDWETGGVITAIGWSGQWTASVENSEGSLHIQAGMENMHLTLHPGERIRGPRILQLYWTGRDLDRSYNLWRQTMFMHILPKVEGETVVPPIAHLSTSFYELNAGGEKEVLSHLDALKGLGFEMFWLDAYWTRDGFPAGMGHYGFPIQRAEPPDRFPQGLRPIGEAAHREGMKFIVWFEPERVAPGTHLAKEHPEWVISPSGDGSGLFNLGIPEARQYMTDYLTTVIREYRMDAIRIDYNIDPLPFWGFLNGQDPSRIGIAEIRYTEGLYRMWDDLRAACPKMLIDNCASGGRRIDLETCSRSLPLWRTDATIGPLMSHDFNQAALQNQVITAGLSRYVPFSASGQMGAAPYLFRSGFNAGISFCEDCRPADYPRALLKQAVAEGKRIRKYFFGSFYPLSEVTTNPGDWCVLQYHRPEERDGMVIAFRRHDSPYASFSCDLHEIDPEASFRVTYYEGYEPVSSVVKKGSQLQHLVLEIGDKPGSLLVEYKQEAGTQ